MFGLELGLRWVDEFTRLPGTQNLSRLPRADVGNGAWAKSEAASPIARPCPAMPPIASVTLRMARSGYKDWGRFDLTYAELAERTAVAGVLA